jgi:hypothetical protein
MKAGRMKQNEKFELDVPSPYAFADHRWPPCQHNPHILAVAAQSPSILQQHRLQVIWQASDRGDASPMQAVGVQRVQGQEGCRGRTTTALFSRLQVFGCKSNATAKGTTWTQACTGATKTWPWDEAMLTCSRSRAAGLDEALRAGWEQARRCQSTRPSNSYSPVEPAHPSDHKVCTLLAWLS